MEGTRRQVKIYLQRVFLPTPSPVLANIHSILAYEVPHTEDVGLPTKFWVNAGPASQPLAGSINAGQSSSYAAGPTLIHDWVCCILCANKWDSPDAASMLTHTLRRWPDIETALGDCTVFSDRCMPVTMRVTLFHPVAKNTR